MLLYYFNPENDLALGCNSRNYFAPRHAVDLRESGALLPIWYAGNGNAVLTDCEPDREWLERMSHSFGMNVEAVTEVPQNICGCSPWGWSPAVCQRFVNAGVGENILPSDSELEQIRRLSHRRITIKVLSELREKGFFRGEVPEEFTDTQKLPEIITKAGSEGIFFKSPWSSSGRGVIPSKGMPLESVITQAGGMIRHQGSVMIEKAYRKMCDFAMLFHSDSQNGVQYMGLSVFDTSSQSYSGNILAGEQKLRKWLSKFVDIEELDAVRETLLPILDRLLRHNYSGYFGVDMMVVAEHDGTRWIHPCVEVNLRMTMGVVAHLFTRDFLAPDAEGVMKILFGGGMIPTPAVIESHRLVSGRLSLVPPGGKFSFEVSAGKTVCL